MISPILHISAGIVGFVTAGGLGALCYGWARRRWGTMALFALMSLTLAVYSICNLLRDASPDPAVVIELTRRIDICVCLFVILLPFLYRALCRQKPGTPETVIVGVYALTICIALVRPTGLTWNSLTAMYPADLGWLGRIYLPHGEYSGLLLPIHLFSLLVLGHCIRIAWKGRGSVAVSAWLFMVLPILLVVVLVHTIGRTRGWWHGPAISEYAGLALYLGLGASVFACERDLLGERDALFGILSEREEKLSALTNAGINFAGLLDPQGKVVLANRVALEYIDATLDDMRGVPFPETPWWNHSSDMQHRLQTAIAEAVAGRADRFEAIHRAEDGSEMILDFSLTPFANADGTIRYLVAEGRDITLHKALEEQLRQVQKMQAIGQLAGGVAHDFNNLLHVIIGHNEMLLADISDADSPAFHPLLDSLSAIQTAAERASLLTRQLLMFSRKAVLEPAVLDLNEVLERTGKILRRLIGEDIVLTLTLAPALQRIKADPGQIEQVCMNLAINARDAMPKGGQLLLETRNLSFSEDYCRTHPDCKPGHFVQFSVSDTGCGMTPEIRAQIFEPFFTTKRPGKGTGLGLATVYGIVQQSEGFITVQSEVGTGTTFRVFLPAVDVGSAALPAETESSGDLNGVETILLVEDEAEVRRIARNSLERHGYRVLEAVNGNHAIQLAEAHPGRIDLLLTDVIMPEMSGGQLSETLCALRPELRVLFMSGYNDDAVVRHGVLEGEDAFLQKPFTPQVLAQKVRTVLDTRNVNANVGTVGTV